MEQEKNCSSCKKKVKKLKPTQMLLIGLSVYIFVSALYGTYKLTSYLVSMFF